MRYSPVPHFFCNPSMFGIVAACALMVGVLMAIPDECYGQGGPIWIGCWQRYEGGGDYPGTDPSVSPDGASVVYSTPATGHGDIYRYDRSIKKNVRLTTDPEYEGSPSYSRDGKRIIFVREKDNVGHLWVMDADGSHQRQITDGPTYDTGAALSKDGKKIVLIRMKGVVSNLWVMDADGGHQKQLTDGPWLDESPMFSPDGSKVFFGREFPKGPVPQRLLPLTGKDSLRWSEIYSVNADGTDSHRLTHNLYSDTPICASLDGKRLFYWRSDDYEKKNRFEGISVMDADGANSRNLGEGWTPAFSPDVRQVAFITGAFGHEVGLMNTDGTGRRTIHSCKHYHSEPTFTPDGSHLVFVEWPEEHGAGRVIIQSIGTSKVEPVPSIK